MLEAIQQTGQGSKTADVTASGPTILICSLNAARLFVEIFGGRVLATRTRPGPLVPDPDTQWA